jgi:glycosyltransferase involved in cell wall biosynthesis
MSFSVVLPTSNELGLDYLPRILEHLRSQPDIELIAVDNASTDGTAGMLEAAGARLIRFAGSNRAQRLNTGIAAAQCDLVLLHHPRSLLEPAALAALHRLPEHVGWGAFSHRFDLAHPLLAWTSWYSNRVRLDGRGIAYLDHCIFLRRSFAGNRPVPELTIFEDTALSRRLLRHSPPRRLAEYATTSAVRYQRNGVWRQALMNQALKIGYGLGLPNRWMNRLYEKGLGLNG